MESDQGANVHVTNTVTSDINGFYTKVVPAGHAIVDVITSNTNFPAGKILTYDDYEQGSDPTMVTVPDVKGDTASGARRALERAGFKVARQHQDVTKQSQDGIVTSQTPGAGSTAKKGSTVTIVIGHFKAPPTTTTTTTTSTTTTTTPTIP